MTEQVGYPAPPRDPPPPPSQIGGAPHLQALVIALKNQWDYVVRLGHVLRLVQRGKLNALGAQDFTLTANAAASTLTDERLTVNSVVFFDPLTANAAAEEAAGTRYTLTADRLNGSWTVTHANNAQTDRTYRVLIIG